MVERGSAGRQYRYLMTDPFQWGAKDLAESKPNINALVDGEDLEGLLEAATYQSFTSNQVGDADDAGSAVRAEAIAALGKLAPDRAGPVLRASLYDSTDEVRCQALQALSALHETEPIGQALRWISKEEPSFGLALDALADPEEEVSLPSVADALVHRYDDELIGEEAAQLVLALLEREDADVSGVLELLVLALRDEREIVVDRAVEMLVWLAPDSVDALVAELDKGSNPAVAAYVLGSIGDPRTLPALMMGLRHPDAKVRKECAAALAELQDPAAVQPLLRATRDPDHAVRTQAALALDGLGSAAVIVGVAALMEPMVEEAVRTAIERADKEAGARSEPAGPPARSRPRHRPNGRSAQAPDKPRSAEERRAS
jgi:HEAT repeat protein